jgi:hypothetical protein
MDMVSILSKRIIAFAVCAVLLIVNIVGSALFMKANPGQELHRIQK